VIDSANDLVNLHGKRVLITRAESQADELREALESLGINVVAIAVTSIHPPEEWGAVDDAIERLDSFEWIVFASVNAVRYFFARMSELKKTRSVNARIAAIGPGTAKKLKELSVTADFVPSAYVADSFTAEFLNSHSVADNVNILWVKGNLGRRVIFDDLRDAGAKVEIVETYRNVVPENEPKVLASLRVLWTENRPHAIAFASSQSAKEFARFLATALALGPGATEAELAPHLTHVRIISIGPETSKSCTIHLGRVDAEASPHTIPGLVQAIVDVLSNELPF
jgi:uroporphyrinogen-III synthase